MYPTQNCYAFTSEPKNMYAREKKSLNKKHGIYVLKKLVYLNNSPFIVLQPVCGNGEMQTPHIYVYIYNTCYICTVHT